MKTESRLGHLYITLWIFSGVFFEAKGTQPMFSCVLTPEELPKTKKAILAYFKEQEFKQVGLLNYKNQDKVSVLREKYEAAYPRIRETQKADLHLERKRKLLSTPCEEGAFQGQNRLDTYRLGQQTHEIQSVVHTFSQTIFDLGRHIEWRNRLTMRLGFVTELCLESLKEGSVVHDGDSYTTETLLQVLKEEIEVLNSPFSSPPLAEMFREKS